MQKQIVPAPASSRVYSFDRKVYDRAARARQALGIGIGLGLKAKSALGSGFNGNFATLFPTSYQSVQTHLGLTYGGTPLASAGNTSTSVLTQTGTLSGVPVPTWYKATNSANIGSGAAFNVYYDGTGTTPAMTGVTPTAGVPVPLTGAGTGLSCAWAAGSSVANDTWKATCTGLADQSGNLKHYAQAGASLQPIVTAGLGSGKVGLLFDGVNDFMSAAVALPSAGTTPWCGWIVFRVLALTAFGRILGSSGDNTRALFLQDGGGTNMSIFYNGVFGGLTVTPALLAWVAADFMFSNSVADYAKVGSAAPGTGINVGNASNANSYLPGNTAQGKIEVLAAGYAPASGFNQAVYRAAVTSFYGGTVAV